MKETVKNLEALRAVMRSKRVSAVIVPGTDPHQSEYVNDHWKLRDWVTGFTGSNGTAVVTLDAAGLWTDSRYFLQAEIQLADSGVVLYKEDMPGEPTINEWIAEHLGENDVLAVDGRLFSLVQASRLEQFCGESGFRFAADFDPFKGIYEDRPELPLGTIFEHEVQYAGESTESKIERVLAEVEKQGAEALLLSALDEIAWIFNIRCNDVDYNPVAISYAYVSEDRNVLFIDPRKVDAKAAEYLKSCNIEVLPYDGLQEFLGKLKNVTVMLDPNKTSDTVARWILNCGVVYAASPVALPKAVKNEVQIEGTRKAMERDGAALVKLYMWLEKAVAEGGVNELDVAAKAIEFRSESPLYRGESFGMIPGYKEHGAIVHYSATEESASDLKPEGLLLVDTGAQYLDGTTDITRTVALGTPTEEERHDYTLVLKGHVALGSAIFPEGTRGSQLDVLARQFLWKECMTYWHGTGHGVGHFLNVHEGPQNIRLNENPAVLVEGMITSDEPGLYKAGKHGIRIENLVLARNYCETEEFGKFMNFEVLTLFPYDSKLIDLSMLPERICWTKVPQTDGRRRTSLLPTKTRITHAPLSTIRSTSPIPESKLEICRPLCSACAHPPRSRTVFCTSETSRLQTITRTHRLPTIGPKALPLPSLSTSTLYGNRKTIR